MAGSKSKGYRPTTPASPCASLVIDATVNSPQPGVISDLKVGDVLDVVLSPGGLGVHVVHATKIVGSLTGTRVASLVNCMNSGFQYAATVKTLTGGLCVVRVAST